MILSTAMAHTQIEHTRSPTMTPLTIQWACQNSVSRERSEEVSGNACCATSFMEHPFERTRWNTRRRTTEPIAPDASVRLAPRHCAKSPTPLPAQDEYSAKLVQTWAIATPAITRHPWLRSG